MQHQQRPVPRSKLDMGGLVAETRDLVRRAADLLREPRPDIFLGRKTQEPFPKEIRGPSNLGYGAPPAPGAMLEHD